MGKRVIEKFVAELDADNTKFSRELKKSAQEAKTWGADLEGYLGTAAKVGAGMAVSIATAAAVSVVSLAKTSKEIEELSSVANASVEEFQRMSFASKRFGIENEKTADILKDVSDKVGDFLQTGGGPLADFFENIAPQVGVTAEQFRRLSGPEALQLYVSSLEKANLSQNEMTFFMEAIASDATALLPLLKDDGKALKELGDEAARTGNIISDLEFSQLREMQRHLDELGALSSGFARRLTLELVPAAGAVSEMMLQASLASGNFGETTALVGDIAEGAIGAIGDTWEDVSLGIAESKAQIAEFAALALEAGAKLDRFFSFGGLNKTLAEGAERQEVLAAAYKGLGEFYRGEFEAGVESRAKDGNFSKRFEKQLEEERKKLADSLEELRLKGKGGGAIGSGVDTEALKAQDKDLSKVKALLAAAEPAWKKYADSVATAKSLLQAGKLSQSEYNNTLTLYKQRLDKATGANDQWKKDVADSTRLAEQAKTELEKLNEELARAQELSGKGLLSDKALAGTTARIEEAKEKLKEANDDLSVFAEQAARNIQDQLGDTILATMNGTTDGLLDAWGDMLKRMVAEAAAAQLSKSLGLENLLSGGKNGDSGLIQAGLSLLSYDGGGYTGDGPRTGGVDGKGGFLAINHPQESIFDHAKGTGSAPTQSKSKPQDVRIGNIVLPGVTSEREGQRAGGAVGRAIAQEIDNARRYQ